jgi:molybdopterin synthase catalytic subunit
MRASPAGTFRLSAEPLSAEPLVHEGAGGFVAFEGRVRGESGGRAVLRLEYEAYTPLAEAEGERILAEAAERFQILAARVVHRVGVLEVGEAAVRVEVAAAHRAAAFQACAWIMDEIKERVPVWKKEVFADGAAEWVNAAG